MAEAPIVTVGADEFRIRLGQWIDRVAAGEEAVVTRRGKPLIRLTPAVPASTAVPAPAVAPPPNAPAVSPTLLHPLGERR